MPWHTIKKTRKRGVLTCHRRVIIKWLTAHLTLVTKLVDSTSSLCGMIASSNPQGDSFYMLYPDGQYGSSAYMARAVMNKILQAGLHYDPAKSCCVS